MHIRPDHHSRFTTFVVDTAIPIVSQTLTQGAHILEPAIHAEVFSSFFASFDVFEQGLLLRRCNFSSLGHQVEYNEPHMRFFESNVTAALGTRPKNPRALKATIPPLHHLAFNYRCHAPRYVRVLQHSCKVAVFFFWTNV